MLRLNLNKDEHRSSMFNKLEGMRRDKKHCDFIIKVGSEVFYTHRNLLAAGSDYFDAMLSHDTKENRSGVVDMIDVDAACVKICVGYIYGGEVEVSMEKCEQLMYVTKLMQLEEISDGIADLIGEKLNPTSYFTTRRIAFLFECTKLKEACEKFAEENFALISKEKGFGELDKICIKKMMKSKRMKISEEEKLDALLWWIKQDDERNRFLCEMLECIELDRMQEEYRRHLLENEPLIRENLEIYRIFSISVMGAMTLRHVENKKTNKGILIFDRKSGYLQCFNPLANTWKQMQKMHDEMTEPFFSAVSLDDHIYILMEDQSVYRLKYSDEAATWEQMADMIEVHGWCPPATVVAGQIYVIGGGGCLSTEAAEKYDPATNQWTRIKDKSQPSRFSQLLGTRGNIYCFGGVVGGKVVNAVQRFDLSFPSWTDVKPMKESRSCAAAVELDGRVYVLGGCVSVTQLKSFERYDPDINEWTSLSLMKVARWYFRAFATEGFIYVVGGCDSSGSIEKYDVVKNEWEMVKMPSGMKLEIDESVNIKLE